MIKSLTKAHMFIVAVASVVASLIVDMYEKKLQKSTKREETAGKYLAEVQRNTRLIEDKERQYRKDLSGDLKAARKLVNA